MVLLIIGIILFIGLVVVHEFGHFIMARRNGVEIEEFGIGFPPAFFRKRVHSSKGDYDFTLNWLPLGGFVKMKGEHDGDVDPGSFGSATVWGKTKIMLAGVVMNLVTAFVLLTALALIGMPKVLDNQFTVSNDTKTTKNEVLVGDVDTKSAAAKVGMKASDSLVAIGETGQLKKVTNADTLSGITKSYAGKTVTIVYRHQGKEHQGQATLQTTKAVEASKKTKNPIGYLGVVNPRNYQVQRSTWSAPIVAVGLMKQITVLTFQGLGKAVAGLGSLIAGALTHNTQARQQGQTQASEQVSGPVGIVFVLKAGTVLGFQFMLFIIAVISLTLAIMNVLPIPALDGGRLYILLISRALGRPLSQKAEEAINASGFMALMLLTVLITIVDVKRFF